MRIFFKPDEVEILSRKGIFPYEWLDSLISCIKQNFQSTKTFLANYRVRIFQKKTMSLDIVFINDFVRM